MITRDRGRSFWAYVLVAAGVVLLAANLGWFAGVGSWVWALLFLAGGAAFLYHYVNHREEWWALIPGSALAGIGVTVLAGDAGGPVFLGLLGAGFAAVYLSGRQRWWAVIPAGALLTLALVAWLEEVGPRIDAGWVFMLGLAATFGYLYLLPEGQGKQRWAVYPALAMAAIAVLACFDTSLGGIVGPLLLIGAGAYLIWRRTERGGGASGPTPEA